MALVIIPIDCDSHAVFSIHSEGTFMGLHCDDCDTTFPPEEE
jgi:hypothetical protein